MKVPQFKQYFPARSTMNSKQKKYYDYWVDNWKKGKKIPVKGNISYIFCYIYDLLSLPFRSEEEIKVRKGIIISITYSGRLPIGGLRKDYKKQAKELSKRLKKIIKNFPEEEKLVEYCKYWLSDSYLLIGDYKKALKVFPKIKVGEQSMYPTERVLNEKLLTKEEISGHDILTLNGPQVTPFGRKNIDKVAQFLEALVRAREEEEKINILEKWKKVASKAKYYIFVGSHYGHELKIPFYKFGSSSTIRSEIKKLTREAENTVREEMGIPKVGEGWVAETELYYKIKESFPRLEVIQHARPKWLGNQHLDIFIPKLKVAIEYHGEQHYRPIDFFGGQKAFESNRRRDKAKKQKCTKHKIKLIEVSKGYRLSKIISEVKK
jgi:tetratricopeptide (TPR) repeat protein